MGNWKVIGREPVLGLRVLGNLVGLEYGIGLLVRVLPKTVLLRRCRACASIKAGIPKSLHGAAPRDLGRQEATWSPSE